MGVDARLRAISTHVRPAVAPSAAATAAVESPPEATFRLLDMPSHEVEAAGRFNNPLAKLAANEIPAIVIRGVLAPTICQQLLQRVHDRGMVPPSYLPFLDLGPSAGVAPSAAWQSDLGSEVANDSERSSRFDIGMSLAAGCKDPTGYFERCRGTAEIYEQMFEGLPLAQQPRYLMYDALGALSGRAKTAVTAYEPDGRQYGPCIIRTHKPYRDGFEGASYSLHYDSARYREQRRGWAVYRFPVQLAGILVLQAPDRVPAGVPSGPSGQVESVYHDSVMYKYDCQEIVKNGFNSGARNPLWPSDVDNDRFRPVVESGVVPSAAVDLEVGDMYFFKSDSVHEAAGFGGSKARSVFCTFIGYDPDDGEIFVWS